MNIAKIFKYLKQNSFEGDIIFLGRMNNGASLNTSFMETVAKGLGDKVRLYIPGILTSNVEAKELGNTKKSHAILHDIWIALDRKRNAAICGAKKPGIILSEFHRELGRLGSSLRHSEYLYQLPQKEVHEYIANFVKAARQTAQNRTNSLADMHRMTRDIFFDLGLKNLLTDSKIFYPRKTRHLYQIMVALDLFIETSSSGVSTVSPSLLKFYEDMSKHCGQILDSSQHQFISDELDKELTIGFVQAVKESALLGDDGNLFRRNALGVLLCLDLYDLLPMFEIYFPEKNSRGQFLTVGQLKREAAA